MRIGVICMIMLFGIALFAENGNEVSLGDFSSGLNGWTFYLGKEFPGAQGNLWREKDSGPDGAPALNMEANFTGGGNYVSAIKPFNKPLNLKSLTITLEASNLKAIVFRIIDATNQVHQQTIKLNTSRSWRTVVINDFLGKVRVIHWGGSNDGKWHGPAKGISIIIDKSNLKDKSVKKSNLIIAKIKGILSKN